MLVIAQTKTCYYLLGSLYPKRYWTHLLFVFSCLMHQSYAASLPPLIVATEIFNPPFIMQGANGQLFGFDIEMMENVCQLMNRECQYRSGFIEKTIITNIEKQKADLGVASITITLERSQHVNFSLPYLPSDAQYLALKKWATVPFSQSVFNGKKIGIQAGTIFEKLINEPSFSEVKIIKYNSTPMLIDALSDGTVDFILQDALAAQYWASQLPVFTTFGKKFAFGDGFAVVVNKNDPELLQQINDALLEYQKNGEFKKTYDRYVTGDSTGKNF